MRASFGSSHHPITNICLLKYECPQTPSFRSVLDSAHVQTAFQVRPLQAAFIHNAQDILKQTTHPNCRRLDEMTPRRAAGNGALDAYS